MSSDKNWIGNKKSTYVTLGASNHCNHDRQKEDYYATHPSVINPLFKNEAFEDKIWEPACGEGHLSKEILKNNKIVKSTDLVDRGFGETLDFLKFEGYWSGDIITNPPYKYAQEFIEKSLEITENGAKVAMFLKLQFLEGQKRNKLFMKYPPKTVYVFSKRQACAMNGEFDKYGVSAVAYAWFVWERGFKGDPIIKWIGDVLE